MTPAEVLAAKIGAYCAAHADPVKAAKWERYFREGYDAWGLLDKDDPLWTVKETEWFEANAELGVDGFLDLGLILLDSGKYEEGALAIRFLKRFGDRLDRRAVDRLDEWFAGGIRNWAHTDVLCSEILAPLLASGRIKPGTLRWWRSSAFPYQRRAFPVALLALLKTPVKIEPLLVWIRPLMLDAERVVQQGVGWFLREAWKKEPAPVEALLAEFKDTAPRLIFQYATEKMTPAQRARFRAQKKRARR